MTEFKAPKYFLVFRGFVSRFQCVCVFTFSCCCLSFESITLNTNQYGDGGYGGDNENDSEMDAFNVLCLHSIISHTNILCFIKSNFRNDFTNKNKCLEGFEVRLVSIVTIQWAASSIEFCSYS